MRLRSHVIIIAAVTLLPIIAIVCFAVVLLFQKGRDIELDHLVDTARALSLAVDREFETCVASIRALAADEHLQTEDLKRFYKESKRVLAIHEVAEAIVLVDPSGRQIMNTRRPFGEALPQYGDPGFIKKVVESGRPSVSNLFIGRIIQTPVISIGVPVLVDGQIKYALTLSLSPSSLQQLLAQQSVAADSLAEIIDGNKIIVARTRELDRFFGKPAGTVAIANTTQNHEGWWFVPRQRSRGVEPSYAAHHRSGFSGWSVVIGLPKSKINAPLWQALQFVVGGIILFLLAALGLAVVFGRRITTSIASLSVGAKALGSGERVPVAASPVFELEQVRRQLESAASKRKEMEASVRHSEARLRAIIDTEPECVKVVAPDGKLVEMNAAGLSMLQADSLAAIADKSLLELVLPAHREAFSQLHQKVMGGESATLEFEIAGLSGRQLWLDTHAAPLRDAAGRVTALLGVTRDITERKFAEERLRYELQLIRNITESASESIFIADGDGNVKFANPAAVKTFGFGLHELLGQSLHATLHHSYVDGRPFPKSDCVLGRTRVSGSTIRNHEDVFFRKDGSPVVVECSNAPIQIDGKGFGAVLIARDISERKRAEEALRAARDELELRVAERTAELTKSSALLREKDEHLTLAQRAGHAGLWSRDLATGTSSMSPEWYELMGFPLAKESVSYAEFLNRVHPDDRPRVEEMSFHQNIGDFDREFRIVHPVKGERWILSRGRRGISTEDGHLRMMGALIDITERKQAEEALRRSEERLQHALTVGSMGLWERNLGTGKVQWDRRTIEIFGIEAETSVDLEMFFSRIHPDDLPVVKSALERTQSTGLVYLCEFRVLRPDGRTIWIHANGGLRRDRDGTPTHIAGINFDITERKAAEEALRESEARLRAILDHNPAPVFIKDTAGRYVHVNKRFEKLFGLQDTHSEGKTDAELFASEQAKAFQRNDRKVLDLGHASQFEEVAQYHDGEHTSIVTKFPLRDGQGNIYGLCGIATDITERKRAEEALRKLTDDLDRRVVERTRELAESQARLRALVAQLSRAEERERRRLAVELHDYLAQMLTISRLKIGRASKLAADDALKNRLAEALESVDDSIAYTRTLMAQLSPRVLYDLGLPAALAWLGARQKERHGLDVELSGEAEELALDEERSVLAYQCVRELLWNIVKHAETNQALISYALEHGELTIEVADDGRGFDPERLHGDGNDVEKFGLFSIRERLELFGGKLEVTSQRGQGTRARFTLPAPQIEIAPVVTQDATPASAAKAAGKRLSVALVDDHEVVRRGLRQLLEEFADLTVVGEAKDGLEGIELARQFRPDVVVMDINMPRMNGIEATKLIIQEMPSTIVIGLSFESGTQVAQAMKAAGAFTCVTKERAVEDIHQAIMDAVAERRNAKIDNGELIMGN